MEDKHLVKLAKSFLEHVLVTEDLYLSMFDLHFYEDCIVVSIAEEHDLGEYIHSTRGNSARYYDVKSYMDIAECVTHVKNVYIEFKKEYNL
jgi:hypothetical protein